MFHIFRLTCLTVHNNVVNLHIQTTGIIIELHLNITRSTTAVHIVLIAGGQGPVCNNTAADAQVDMLATRRAERANGDAATGA